MALDVVRCHQMSYEGQERTGTEEKRKEKRIGCRNKNIAKSPDYADRRELKSLSYFGI